MGPSPEPSPIGEPIADDEAAACHLAASGVCNMRNAEPAEISWARSEAEEIRTVGICNDIRTMALSIINANRLKAWTNEVRWTDGRVILGDQGWEFVEGQTFPVPIIHLYTAGGFNTWTIAHEAIHAMHKVHTDTFVNPDGVTRNLDLTAKHCAGL